MSAPATWERLPRGLDGMLTVADHLGNPVAYVDPGSQELLNWCRIGAVPEMIKELENAFDVLDCLTEANHRVIRAKEHILAVLKKARGE